VAHSQQAAHSRGAVGEVAAAHKHAAVAAVGVAVRPRNR
jgi:hypothetical protein